MDDRRAPCKALVLAGGGARGKMCIRDRTEDEKHFYTWTLQSHIDLAKAVWLDYCECKIFEPALCGSVCYSKKEAIEMCIRDSLIAAPGSAARQHQSFARSTAIIHCIRLL